VDISWKNNKNLFRKQLSLNLEELSRPTLPYHWTKFIEAINTLHPHHLLDIGCGCGTYLKICQRYAHKPIHYVGVDYSEHAIQIAKQHWNYNDFFVRDYRELTPQYVQQFDVVHTGAMLDVLTNGDEALEFLLSLYPKVLLIGRMKFIAHRDSFHHAYRAYDEIETVSYHHNFLNFVDMMEKYGYEYKCSNLATRDPVDGWPRTSWDQGLVTIQKI